MKIPDKNHIFGTKSLFSTCECSRIFGNIRVPKRLKEIITQFCWTSSCFSYYDLTIVELTMKSVMILTVKCDQVSCEVWEWTEWVNRFKMSSMSECTASTPTAIPTVSGAVGAAVAESEMDALLLGRIGVSSNNIKILVATLTAAPRSGSEEWAPILTLRTCFGSSFKTWYLDLSTNFFHIWYKSPF